MLDDLDYWKECINIAADECDLQLDSTQLAYLAESVQGGHENYGLAFYSPPSSERISDIENEWKQKLSRLQKEFDAYKDNAESAVKTALKMHATERVSIAEHGEVYHTAGRTTRIL